MYILYIIMLNFFIFIYININFDSYILFHIEIT